MIFRTARRFFRGAVMGTGAIVLLAAVLPGPAPADTVDYTTFAHPVGLTPRFMPSFRAAAAEEDERLLCFAYNGGSGAPDSLFIVDLADPLSPRLAGALEIPRAETITSGPYSQMGVAVAGATVCVVNHRPTSTGPLYNFREIDIATVEQPAIVGELALSGPTRGVAIAGRHAYVASSQAGLNVVDLDDPAGCRLVGSLAPPGTDAYRVAVAGSLAFLINNPTWGGGAVDIVDVADPAAPVLRAHLDVKAERVAVHGDHLFVAGDCSLRVFDLSDPADPTEIADPLALGFPVALVQPIHALFLRGTELHVHMDRFMYLVDVTDPGQPALSAALDHGDAATVYDRDGIMYAGVAGGLRLWDVANPALAPAAPTVSPRVTFIARGLMVANRHAFVIQNRMSDPQRDDMSVFSLASADTTPLVATTELPELCLGWANHGDLVFVGSRQLFQVYDVSVPASPTLSGQIYEHVNYAGERFTALQAADGFVYCRTSDESLQVSFRVIDVGDPSAPSVAASLDRTFDTIALDGSTAVLAGFAGDLSFVDIGDPRAPVAVGGGLDLGGVSLTGVIAAGGRAYCAGIGYTWIVNYEDPAAPWVEAVVRHGLVATGRQALFAGRLYQATRDGCVVIDCSTPAAPVLAGYLRLPYWGAIPVIDYGVKALAMSDAPGGRSLVLLHDFQDYGNVTLAPLQDTGVVSAAGPGGVVPAGSSLDVRPNPFNPRTLVEFSLARPGRVTAEVFDLSGRRTAVLVDGPRDAGRHTVGWDGLDGAGRPVGTGVYLVRVTSDGRTIGTRKVALVR